jgi:hypothetical protein
LIAGDKVVPHTYAGRRLTPGHEFDCEAKDVDLMVRVFGHHKKEVVDASVSSYSTRDMTASSRTRAARVKQ